MISWTNKTSQNQSSMHNSPMMTTICQTALGLSRQSTANKKMIQRYAPLSPLYFTRILPSSSIHPSPILRPPNSYSSLRRSHALSALVDQSPTRVVVRKSYIRAIQCQQNHLFPCSLPTLVAYSKPFSPSVLPTAPKVVQICLRRLHLCPQFNVPGSAHLRNSSWTTQAFSYRSMPQRSSPSPRRRKRRLPSGAIGVLEGTRLSHVHRSAQRIARRIPFPSMSSIQDRPPPARLLLAMAKIFIHAASIPLISRIYRLLHQLLLFSSS